MNFEKELDFIKTTVTKASQISLDIFNGQQFSVTEKDHDQGPVTEADHRVSEFLIAEINKAYPNDAIVSEESESVVNKRSQRQWFIDPIDGTKEFIKGNGEWSIMVGLVHQGRPVVGVVSQPQKNLIYFAAKNYGAKVNELNGGSPRPLNVNNHSSLAMATNIGSRSHKDPKLASVLEKAGVTKSFAHGSVGLKLAQIAEGNADLYLNFSKRCHLWDFCAGEIILQEAGGISFINRAELIAYSTEDTKVRGLYWATTKSLQKPLATVIAESCDSDEF